MLDGLEELLLATTVLVFRLMLMILVAVAPLMLEVVRVIGWQLLTRPRLLVLTSIALLWLMTDRGFFASVVAVGGASALIALDTLRAHVIR
jgi:hypothetical protein